MICVNGIKVYYSASQISSTKKKKKKKKKKKVIIPKGCYSKVSFQKVTISKFAILY